MPPTGNQLKDAHPTTISFSLNPSLALWEVGVQPMGVDGGEGIPQSNMRNVTWETSIGRALKTLTAADLDCHYDEKVYGDLAGMINKNQQLTVTFPTGRTIVFWGRIRNFQPQKMTQHQKPTARVMVEPSNLDNSGNEVGPVVGTTSASTATTTTTAV